MKSVIVCLIVPLFLVLPTQCLAQWHQLSEQEQGLLLRSRAGTPLKVTLTSGQIIKGKFTQIQRTTEPEGFSHIEIKQKTSTLKIPFSDVREIKANYNFFQKVGRGFGTVGEKALTGFAIAMLGIIYGIDWLMHGGEVRWEYP